MQSHLCWWQICAIRLRWLQGCGFAVGAASWELFHNYESPVNPAEGRRLFYCRCQTSLWVHPEEALLSWRGEGAVQGARQCRGAAAWAGLCCQLGSQGCSSLRPRAEGKNVLKKNLLPLLLDLCVFIALED